MTLFDAAIRSPRLVGVACAIGAVALGLGHMAAAGAPGRYLVINAAALGVGLTLLGLFGGALFAERSWTSAAIAAMAGALLATALSGDSVEGATRWVRLGGLSLQPSLILLPVMLVAFARSRNELATAGIVAAAALAIQPDRAMAGMLAAGLAVLAVLRPDRLVLAALGASLAGFAVTLARPDRLPAAAHVEGVLYSSFEVHLLAGLAVVVGLESHAVFGAVWLAAILAAALGNYPTPLVGYGASAIIGYALSLLALPKLEGLRRSPCLA
jgi:cell division protein FtsW (lipid II flippase)